MRPAIFVFFLMAFAGAQGQDSLTVEMLVPDRAIKVSPLHLLNFYSTIEVSYEEKVARLVTLQLEAGYVLPGGAFQADGFDGESDYQNKRGVKLKLEGRYYFWGRTDRRKLYYAAIEPYMNIINFDRPTTSQECFDLECNHQFTRRGLYKVEYREQGFSLKAGLLRYMGTRFIFDINSGFTLRNILYREPPGQFDGDGFLFPDIPNEDDRVALSPSLGIRIGYRLK